MGTILIIDDDPANQRVLEYTLTKRGHVVSKAWNGRDALEQLGQQDFDLVITDFHMPEMDGLALLEELHLREQYKTTPVIMVTGSSADQDRLSAKAAGVTTYLTKPFSTYEIVEAVKKALG